MKKGFKFNYCLTNPKSISGVVYYRGMQFGFTLNEQKAGNYRGRITVIDPDTNKPIEFIKKQKYGSKEKKEIKEQFQELNQPAGCSKTDRENYICERIQNIYQDNERFFLRFKREHAEPETITVGLACEIFGAEFISKEYSRNTVDTNNKKLQRLENIVADLNEHPMMYYSQHPNLARKVIEKRSVNDQKLVRLFWDYIIAREKMIIKNPFREIEDTHKAATSRKRKAATKTSILPKAIQEKFNSLLLDQHGGRECGAALVASGFSVKDACSKCWKDFVQVGSLDPDQDEMDFCVIVHKRPDLLIAVHDYTRPLVPVYATVLQLRYTDLLKDYSVAELENMPIVSQSTDPRKTMTPAALQQDIRNTILEAGMKLETLKSFKESRDDPVSSKLLLNRYRESLVNGCKLNPQSGTYIFLLGKSLADDTTSTNYVSFTCEAGQKRLYNILRRLRQKRKNERTVITTSDDKNEVITVLPDESNQNAGIVINMVLRSGEEAIISSHCGAVMQIKARQLEGESEYEKKREEAV